MCDSKPKKPCVPEEEKKCKEVKPPSVVEAQECEEPEPPPLVEKVLFVAVRYLKRNQVQDSNNPLEQERAKCLEDCHVEPVFKLLQECNKRVNKKLLYTAETCHEETVDLIQALDHCIKDKAFNRLV